MKNQTVCFIYYKNGKKYCSADMENQDYKINIVSDAETIKADVTAKTEILMHRFDIEYKYEFESGDVFFGNGYQAWTTSREYKKTDKMKDKFPLKGSAENLIGITSDFRFVKFPKNSGEFHSHTYTYIRNGEKLNFIGSLTEKFGFTVIYADMNQNILKISKDVEGVTLKADENYELLDAVTYCGGYDEVFDKYFDAMGLKKPVVEHMSGYTSWYNYFQKIDENIILRDLNALDSVKDKVSIFQVDDGYETFVGDWLDPNPKDFPHGIKYIADKIHEKGYKAGLWIAPFSLQKVSKTYKEHPDWVLRDEKNKPILGVFAWGGAYTMDIYNPDAREYMKKVLTTAVGEWGYDMVKLDFLYSQCMIPRQNKSRGTIMCEAMAFLRECCGDKLILGCGVPLGAAFGYVDACRISCDVDLKYKGKYYNKLHVNNELPSAQNAITNSIFRRHLNGRAFCNDPDVFFLRDFNLTFTYEQKLLLAFINHICGDVLFVSDDVSKYGSREIEVLKKCFEKSEYKIISAGYTTGQNVEMVIDKDGERKVLKLNIKTGKSNIKDFF